MEILRLPKQRKMRKLESEDEDMQEALPKNVDVEMSEAVELTDISKCGPAAPGKKWVQVKKTESGMLEDGSFFSKDYMVWEQVDDIQEKKPAKINLKPSEPAQKRAPAP